MMGGLASHARPPSWAAIAMRAAIERSHIEPSAIDEVILGQVIQAGAGQAPARQASIARRHPDRGQCHDAEQGVRLRSRGDQPGGARHPRGRLDRGRRRRHGEHEPGPHLLPKARFGYRMGSVTVQDAVVLDGLWSPGTTSTWA